MSRVTAPPAPHLLAAALCVGLAGSLVVRESGSALAILAGTFALGALLAGTRRTAVLTAALLLAGLWWGGARLAALDGSVLAGRIGEADAVIAEVTGPARRSEFSIRVPVRVRRLGRLQVDEPARLELPPGRAPPQGAILELVATVRRPRPAEPNRSFDEATYLRRQGVHVVLRAGWYREIGRRGGLQGVADNLRRSIARSIALGAEGERRAVVAAVVLGADEGLDATLQDDFRASGLYHLLAVSGQNVAYVIFGTLVAAWALGLPRWVAHFAALASVFGYVLAVGWQPSVVRAGLAGSLASLAWLSARAADRWYFLLVGAAVLLAANPYSALEPGFQLSFAAVGAIFVLVPWLERRLEGYPVPRRLADVVVVSVVCGVITAPILWLHFGAVPVFSIAANALAAPVVAPLLGLALVAAPLALVAPGAAAALGWMNGWLAAYLAWCARLVGGLPYAQIASLRLVVGVCVAFAVFALTLRLARPRRKAFACTAALALAAGAAWHTFVRGEALAAPTGLRITFLDVGQGDATLIEVPEGAVLVDQGPPEANVAGRLRALGVRRLELLVMTHPSRDNIGGAKDIVESLPVGMVLDPALAHENPFGRPAVAEARRRGARIAVVRAGQRYRLGGLTLRVLWPPDAGSRAADPNDYATVILASYGDVDALLPADAESNVTLPLRPPPVEILKVGHHGSADAGLGELLALLRPALAIVSVGSRNDYGHPTPSTLAELRAFPGVSIFRTDEDGSVGVESDGRRLAVRSGR
ncbi:MAG: ComEC/Rec2 family competence protein [Actinobacteria bacterium]|nr:ComEC/Rec2 family competence protein [Actinomycetota bacterium]